jgi:hypothetical protein
MDVLYLLITDFPQFVACIVETITLTCEAISTNDVGLGTKEYPVVMCYQKIDWNFDLINDYFLQ